MDYNRIALTELEKQELQHFKMWFPFRKWFGVKPEMAEFRCFDSQRKAKNYATKHAPAAIYE